MDNEGLKARLVDWIDSLDSDYGYIELHPNDAVELQRLLEDALDAIT